MKFAMAAMLCASLLSLVMQIVNGAATIKSITGISVCILVFAAVFYFTFTRDIIEYDDIELKLFVVDHKRKTEYVIPVENIEKIVLSVVGWNIPDLLNYPYEITYRDFNQHKRILKLYPIAFRKDISTLITDTKLKNPGVIVKNWSIG